MNKQMLRNVILWGLFAIPFVPFLVSGSFFFPFITTKAFVFRIIVEIIFGAWLILAITDQEYRPKKSPIILAVFAFIAVIGLANLFGEEPVKSFWSNYERMEGYVAVLHFGALFLVMSSILGDKEWKWWWNTSLVASLFMVFYAVFQLLGSFEIHQGGARVDGTIGNASYLALYLLIHIFVAIYYFAKSKASYLRWVYGALIFMQVSILYFTATRGAILGLLGGVLLVALMNLKNREDERIRKASRYLLIGLMAFITLFYLARNTEFVKDSPVLSRFSNLSMSALKTEGRAFVWPMAIEGIKERPILGWGQDNFNYVFAEHYKAEMFRLEPWFDRAHNIFLDWGIAAGLLGLGTYLSLYFIFIFVLWKRESNLSYVEKSVLTGLLSAYFFNNFFVFDNLLSYVLFFSLLAYVHTKVSVEWPRVSAVFGRLGGGTAVGVIVLFVCFVLYVVNIKPIIANTNLIQALKVSQSEGNKVLAMKYFRKAYETSRLGRPEVVEWVSSSGPAILADESISMEERNAYFEFAKKAVEEMTQELSGDPRYEIVAGTFYYNLGGNPDALRHLNRAKELMPEKQIIYFNLGQIFIQEGKMKEALENLRVAYELAPEYEEAQMIYAAGAVYAKDTALVREVLSSINPQLLLSDPRVLAAMYQTGQTDLLMSVLYDLRKKVPEAQPQIDEYIRQIETGSI